MEARRRAPMAQNPRDIHNNMDGPQGRIVISVFWAVTHTLAGFVQQLAEFFAPLLLLGGLLWKLAPAAAGMLADKARTVSTQADLDLSRLDAVVPGHLSIAGVFVSAATLLFYGVVLLAVAAVASTVVVVAGRRL